MTACALPCFMFTCVPSGKVKLIPDIGSVASAKPSAPSAVTGRNIEPVVSEDGSNFVFRPVLRLTYQPFRFHHTKPFGIHPSFHAALVDMNFSQKGGQTNL